MIQVHLGFVEPSWPVAYLEANPAVTHVGERRKMTWRLASVANRAVSVDSLVETSKRKYLEAQAHRHTAVCGCRHLNSATAVANDTDGLVSEFERGVPCSRVCLVLEIFEARDGWPFPIAAKPRSSYIFVRQWQCMVAHLLQHASGVDQYVGIVEECSLRFVDGLDLDLPLSFICVPPRTDDQMTQLDVGVEMVPCNHPFQVTMDLLLRCVTVFRFLCQ